MRVRAIGLFAVSGVLAAGLLVASPAEAKTKSFPDHRGDVHHAADVHRVKVTYKKKGGVHVRIKVRNAEKRGLGFRMFFNLGRGRGPEFQVIGPIGRVDTDWRTLVTKSNWQARQLDLLCWSKVRTNVRRDTLHVRIARSCLRNPDQFNLRTGRVIHRKAKPAPKAVRVAVQTSQAGRGAKDWAPKRKTFYRAVPR